VYPVLWSVSALLGVASTGAVGLVTGVVAFGAAYPLVAGDWSRDALGETVVAFVGSLLCLGVLAVVVIAASGLRIAGSDPRPQVALFASAYVVTAGVVGLRRR
jgi:hypothetical protein